MNEGEIYNKLRQILIEADNSAFDLRPAWVKLTDIIRGFQNAPRPLGAYGMINLISRIEGEEIQCVTFKERVNPASFEGKDIIEVLGKRVEWTFSINVYATYALDYLENFINYLDSSEGQFSLDPLVSERVGATRRLGEMIQQRWEGRGNFDLTLAGYVHRGVIVQTIDQISLNAKEYDWDANIPQPVNNRIIARP